MFENVAHVYTSMNTITAEVVMHQLDTSHVKIEMIMF